MIRRWSAPARGSRCSARGLSVVVPQVFAAGGRADPARPGSGLAKVVGLGYAGLAAGPAVIGAVASRVGLHLALGIPVLLALWIAVAAPCWRPGGASGTEGAEARARSGEKEGVHPCTGTGGLTVCTWTTRRSWRGSAA